MDLRAAMYIVLVAYWATCNAPRCDATAESSGTNPEGGGEEVTQWKGGHTDVWPRRVAISIPPVCKNLV